jgi:hypothetical protein
MAGGWFVLREKYCWLVADKPNEQAEDQIVLVFADIHLTKKCVPLYSHPDRYSSLLDDPSFVKICYL